jgi:hypothetical protein
VVLEMGAWTVISGFSIEADVPEFDSYFLV